MSTTPGRVIVTGKEQVALFPDASVNVYVTVVVPIEKLCPGLWVLDRVGMTPELSVADGMFHVAMALVAVLLAAWLVTPVGQLEMTGGVISTTGPVPAVNKTFDKTKHISLIIFYVEMISQSRHNSLAE